MCEAGGERRRGRKKREKERERVREKGEEEEEEERAGGGRRGDRVGEGVEGGTLVSLVEAEAAGCPA